MESAASQPRGNPWLSRNVLFLSLSAFFADSGYQAVTAIFPLLIILYLHEPAYVYGILLAMSYGLGSAFSIIGGRLGEKFGKKPMALLGNLLIPLMSVSVLFHNIYILGAFFVAGWWARYFRTPVRRSWMVEVSNRDYQPKIFGFLHALDVGGGLIAVAYSIILVSIGTPLDDIILVTAIPILISSLMLVLAGTKPHESFQRIREEESEAGDTEESIHAGKSNTFAFRIILLSATLFGFSYYALGFPIVTVAETHGGYVYGILTFGIYLGISALAGYTLGSLRGRRPLRTLWTLGYGMAGIASLIIGFSYLFGSSIYLFYLGAAVLGFSTGSVETFEPVLTAFLAKTKQVSSWMSWLSSSRAVGLFVANTAMGALFMVGQFYSYLYASVTAIAAAAILATLEVLRGRSLKWK